MNENCIDDKTKISKKTKCSSSAGMAKENPTTKNTLKKPVVCRRSASCSQNLVSILNLGFSTLSLLISLILVFHVFDLENRGKHVDGERFNLKNQQRAIDELLSSISGLKRRVTDLEAVNKVRSANDRMI